MRIGLDSNFLAYFAQVRNHADDTPKIAKAATLVDSLNTVADLVAPIQALGELFIVLVRGRRHPSEARAMVRDLEENFICPGSNGHILRTALELVQDRRLQFWDSMIIAASAEAGCTLLLSEDMQDGFAVAGLTIVNPFTASPHPKLARLLA
jgi:predicted nucleic acid-binding protein